MNLRETLDYQYKLLEQGDPHASANIDRLLSKAFDIPHLTLFLYKNTKKKYYQTLKSLVIEEPVSDFELGRSLSSLLNSLLNELTVEESSYHSLHLPKISSLLNQFLIGDINQQPIKDFFKEYLL